MPICLAENRFPAVLSLAGQRNHTYSLACRKEARSLNFQMKLNLRLSHKGLILVSIPLLFELFFVSYLSMLLVQADEDIRREAHSREVVSKTNIVMQDLLLLFIGVGGPIMTRSSAFMEHATEAVTRLPNEFDELIILLRSDPDKQQAAMNIRLKWDAGYRLLNDARIKFKSHDIRAVSLLPEIKSTAIELLKDLNQIVAIERKIEDSSPEKQAQRKQTFFTVLVGAVVFNVLLTIALAIYFTKGIAARLNTVISNADRLAVGQKLAAPIDGSDEIATLDQVFHQMASTIDGVSHRERALTENARDVICSLDHSCRFSNVNPAAEILWGYTTEELLGRRAVEIIHPDDVEKFTACIEEKIQGRSQEAFECRVNKKSSGTLDMLFSAEWSRDERTLYCVCHDITERKLAETLTRLAEQRVRSIVESMPTGLIIFDNNQIEMVNPALDRMFELSSQGKTAIGKPLSILFPEAKNLIDNELIADARDKTFQTQAQRSDGSSFPVQIQCREYETIEGKRMMALVIDLTEQEKIERLKQEFLMIISHELRTPLTSMTMLLSMLKDGNYGDLSEKGKSKVDIAESNITRLIKLINELLDVETLESGNIALEIKQTELETIVERATEAVRGAAKARQIKLDVKSEDLDFNADEDRLIQVTINFLSNAIKFSQEGGTISIIAAPKDDRIVLKVTDTGRGIPASEQSVIFDKFRQVEQADRKEKGGIGLGLAICKTIIEKHSGQIGVESTVGKGSTFWFSVPNNLEVSSKQQKS
jgi:PAS domain S-box-containing protein